MRQIEQLTHFSLFTGIGGIDLAAEWAGFETVGQCEWADYPTKVLEKHWPIVPRWRDIRSVTAESFRERTGLHTVTIVSGGFPCQPFSLAGQRKGKEDDRYLWPEMLRVIQELQPTWVIGENVAGIISMAEQPLFSELENSEIGSTTENMVFEEICQSLENIGYEVQSIIIPACAKGAPHRRDRTVIMAYSRCSLRQGKLLIGEHEKEDRSRHADKIERSSEISRIILANTNSIGSLQREHEEQPTKRRVKTFSRSPVSSKNVADTVRNGSQTRITNTKRWKERKTAESFYNCPDVSNPNKQYDDNSGYGASEICREQWKTEIFGDICNTTSKGFQNRTTKPMGGSGSITESERSNWWSVEPDVGRVANGIPNRVDRLKCLGNAVVPQQVYPILKAIADIERGCVT